MFNLYDEFDITNSKLPVIITCKKHGDFDTKAVLYLTKPDGERVEVNRYFREPESDVEEELTYYGWIEISKEEYEERKARRIDK